jgi:hypothetical protein
MPSKNRWCLAVIGDCFDSEEYNSSFLFCFVIYNTLHVVLILVILIIAPEPSLTVERIVVETIS